MVFDKLKMLAAGAHFRLASHENNKFSSEVLNNVIQVLAPRLSLVGCTAVNCAVKLAEYARFKRLINYCCAAYVLL